MLAFVKRNFLWVSEKQLPRLRRSECDSRQLQLERTSRMRTPVCADKTVDVSSWINGDEFGEITRSDSANPIRKLESRVTLSATNYWV